MPRPSKKTKVTMAFLGYDGDGVKGPMTREIAGYALFPPGLVATRPQVPVPGLAFRESKRGWTIMHQATGLVLSHVRMKTLYDVQRICCDIADLGLDWTAETLPAIRESFTYEAASFKYQDCEWDGRTFREAVFAIFGSPPSGAQTMGVIRT